VRAAVVLGASEGVCSEVGGVGSACEAEWQQRVTDYVLEGLGPERAAELRSEGAALTLDELLDHVASGA